MSRKIILVLVLSVLSLFFLQYQSSRRTRDTKAAGETFVGSFSPATAVLNSAQTKTVTFRARPSTNIRISGYHLKVFFDPVNLQLTSLSYLLGTVSTPFGDDLSSLSSINQKGIIYLDGEVPPTFGGQTLNSGVDTNVISLTFVSKSSLGSTVKVAPVNPVLIRFDPVTSFLVEVPMLGSAEFLVNGGAPTPGPRLADCDVCGFCQISTTPQPTPQTWESCRDCLYPATKPHPASDFKTLLIDTVANSGPSPLPGRQYSYIGCVETPVGSFADQKAAASVTQKFLTVIIGFAGALALIFFLYGAFVVATSKGDKERLRYGKRIIVDSIVGLIFTLSAVFIVNTIAGGVHKIPGFG